MAEQIWKTAITDVSGGQIRVRGYDIADLMEHLSFADVIYLILKGELPNNQQRRMMEALLVSSIDHGPTPPSNLAARAVFSGGNPLNAAVAAGVLTIGDSHGGAIEQCARILQDWAKKDGAAKDLAAKLVAEFKEKNKRMPGYGHRIHKRDPRTVKLLEIAERIGYKCRHIEIAVEIQDELERTSGKELPLDFLLRTMRLREPFHREGESSLDFSTRYQAWDRRTLAAAQAAAPFCHAKLASVEHTGKDGGPINHHLTIEIVG